MEITAGLLAKVGLSLGAAGAGVTGVYFGGDYLVNNSLSKYERALINFLSKTDHDFAFTSTLQTSELDFSSTPKKITISANIQINTGTNSLFKNGSTALDNNDQKLAEIKKLSGGNWTWECEFTFKKKEGDENENTNNIKDDFKNRILGDQDKGLIGILKKDLSNYADGTSEQWTKKELKQVKIDFIRKCGYSRGMSENKRINGETTASNIKINIPKIEFIKKTETGGSNTHLVPEYESSFNYWFEERYATRSYKTS